MGYATGLGDFRGGNCYFAGGGGASGYYRTLGGYGGGGGGYQGDGRYDTDWNKTKINTGGGGGAGVFPWNGTSLSSGNGSSGVVIVRYAK
jgi:hypothetical protein